MIDREMVFGDLSLYPSKCLPCGAMLSSGKVFLDVNV
jgi:hypothetical protein